MRRVKVNLYWTSKSAQQKPEDLLRDQFVPDVTSCQTHIVGNQSICKRQTALNNKFQLKFGVLISCSAVEPIVQRRVCVSSSPRIVREIVIFNELG